MKAMIFAAGLGTRLRPFTLEHPKALVPVGGKPMLRRVIEKLRDSGITRMVINTHHFADQIADYLADNDNFGCDIDISFEPELLDTGGGLLKARPLLDDGTDEPVLIHNADILTDFPIKEMEHCFLDNEADVTLLVDRRDTSRYFLFGPIGCALSGHVNLKNEAPDARQKLEEYGFTLLAFGGVHIISQKALDALAEYAGTLDRPDGPFSIVDFYKQNTDLYITPYTPTAPYRWHDIGKLSTLAEAENTL